MKEKIPNSSANERKKTILNSWANEIDKKFVNQTRIKERRILQNAAPFDWQHSSLCYVAFEWKQPNKSRSRSVREQKWET